MNWDKLQLFSIDIIFMDLRNYQNLIEDFLSNKKNELEENYNQIDLEKEAAKAGPNKDQYYQHLIDSFAERHHEISRQFPHNFRASFLIQIVSVIESELKKICNHYGASTHQKFRVDDLKGHDDLEKCKIYLKTTVGLNFINFEKEWNYIKLCKLLRNKIVHNDSTIKRTDNNLINFSKKSESIEFLNYEYTDDLQIEFIIVNKKLIDKLLDSSKHIFNILLCGQISV